MFQISIQSVYYGLANSSCSLSQSSCNSSYNFISPIRRLEAECQGKESCTLLVNSQNLLAGAESEDPCPEDKRQLLVTYQCRPSSLRTKLTCPRYFVSNLSIIILPYKIQEGIQNCIKFISSTFKKHFHSTDLFI